MNNDQINRFLDHWMDESLTLPTSAEVREAIINWSTNNEDKIILPTQSEIESTQDALYNRILFDERLE